MMILRPRSAALFIVGGILGFTAGNAQADVIIENTTSVAGVGAMSFANMTGTVRTSISGNNARIDSDTKMQSKIVGFLARNSLGPSAEIVLLDQDKLYYVNMNKKEYTETSFEQLRAQMQKMSDQMNASDGRAQPSAVDQSKCVWLPAKASVNRSGEKAQFAGYDAQRLTVTATQPCQDKDTGEICEIALVLDQWISADFGESSEARKFYAAYASKMGIDIANSQDVSQRAKSLFGQYKGVWTEIAEQMPKVKGYPVKSSFSLGIGGPQCKNSASQQAQTSQTDDASAGPGGIAGAVVGKFGGLFQKKKDPAESPAAPPAEPVVMPPGDIALMTVSSQLVSVSTTGVSADAFNVPTGFKKIEVKTL